MVYTLRFFSSKCSLFHNSNVFGSCIINILHTGCTKIKKKLFRRQKVNVLMACRDTVTGFCLNDRGIPQSVFGMKLAVQILGFAVIAACWQLLFS